MNSLHTVGVAQLAEHRTVAPDVVGSIPITHPKFSIILRKRHVVLLKDDGRQSDIPNAFLCTSLTVCGAPLPYRSIVG
jgi:hypothetical protein